MQKKLFALVATCMLAALFMFPFGAQAAPGNAHAQPTKQAGQTTKDVSNNQEQDTNIGNQTIENPTNQIGENTINAVIHKKAQELVKHYAGVNEAD